MSLDAMSRRLQAAVPRFTARGFDVVPMPERLYSYLLQVFVEGRYIYNAFMVEQPHGVIHCRDEAPTLVLGGTGFGDARPGRIHTDDEFRGILERFCGFALRPTYWYGPRLYQSGAILNEHIDRPLSHLVSATIHIDSDLDAPWPIVVDDGTQRHELTLEKGHMVLYEGVRLNHFRPTPLSGRWYAGAFMHYTPVDASMLPAAYVALAQEAQPCFVF